MKHLKYILTILFAIPVAIFTGCSSDEPAEPKPQPGEGECYLVADLETGAVSRMSYEINGADDFPASGSIAASWEEGDVIKVYETDLYSSTYAFTDVYHDYADYAAQNPYPSVPQNDCYYRFECIRGMGTPRGVFRYVGRATSSIKEDPVHGAHTIHTDVECLYKIRNWSRFQGLVVFESPLRRVAPYVQNENSSLSHIKYAQRLTTVMTAQNFQWWFDSYSHIGETAGSAGLILKNVGTSIYRLVLGCFDGPVYGGSTVTLSMPLSVDSQPVEAETITLTLGSDTDYGLGKAPWIEADPEGLSPNSLNTNLVLYLVGRPGQIASGAPVTVTLNECASGKTYQWNLTAPRNMNFKQGFYYTFDLRDDAWTLL